MPDEERCPKNPSLLTAYCSHCQGAQLRTANNPRFSIRPGYWQQLPMVEVLKDGGPVHRFDSHFRFGVRNAQMILSCLPVIREFRTASESQRQNFRRRLIVNDRRKLTVFICTEPHEDFEDSTGEMVQRPWLHLKTLPDQEKIGLGITKCRAISAVAEDLEYWLASHGAFVPEFGEEKFLD